VLDKNPGLTIFIPVHPKGGIEVKALCGPIKFFLNKITQPWTLQCALGYSHAGIEKGFPQTVSTKLENANMFWKN